MLRVVTIASSWLTTKLFRLQPVPRRRKVGVTDTRLRKWLLSISAFLRHQNRGVADAMALWKRSLDAEFEGVEPCLICYRWAGASVGMPHTAWLVPAVAAQDTVWVGCTVLDVCWCLARFNQVAESCMLHWILSNLGHSRSAPHSVVASTNGALPRLHCRTCAQRFHAACLYKWFKSSAKSSCPHCQSPW